MYFIKYELDLTNPSIQQSLANEYDMHRNILSMFASDRKDNNILYRRVNNILYIYSDVSPKINHDGYIKVGEKCVSLKPTLNETYNFNILTFPSVKKQCSNTKNSRRVSVRGGENKIQWFLSVSHRHGFDISECDMKNADEVTFEKNNKSTTITPCEFSGTLSVTDIEKFKDAFRCGIGPEKAFGCGMLLLSK